MLCPRCQSQVGDSLRYCVNCGFDLVGSGAKPEAPAPYPGYPPAAYPGGGAVEPRQSGLGIASFVLGLVAVGIFFLTLIWAAALIGGLWVTLGDIAAITVLWVFAGLLALVGLGLGIAGIVQKRRKRGLAIAGTVICGLFVFLYVVLIAGGAAS